MRLRRGRIGRRAAAAPCGGVIQEFAVSIFMRFRRGTPMKCAKVSVGRVACVSLLMALVGAPVLAEIDPTGTWLIVYHEDWIEIGTGPDIADYAGLPITPAAAQRGLNWHSSLVNVPERQCQQIPLEY